MVFNLKDDLFSNITLSADYQGIYSNWNVTVRNILNLERSTHRFMIEPLSGCLHPQAMLASRYFSFYSGLVNSSKFCVRYLARLAERDMRTVMGRTLNYILEQCGMNSSQLSELSSSLIKKKVKYLEASEVNQWRVRDGKVEVDGFTNAEIQEMLANVCTT